MKTFAGAAAAVPETDFRRIEKEFIFMKRKRSGGILWRILFLLAAVLAAAVLEL